MAMNISSTAFEKGYLIPKVHTCDGDDLSPAIWWENAPKATVSFALIMEDPDAPNGTFTHWIVYNLPHNCYELEKIIPIKNTLDNGAIQAKNDFGKIGYGGPCPPDGEEHRYFFKLYALDRKLDPNSINNGSDFYRTIKGSVLEEAEYMGRYAR